MSDQKTKPSRLPVHLRLLGWGMRRLPTDIRRIDMLWHWIYNRIGGGAYDDDPSIDSAWPAGLQPAVFLPRLGGRMELDLRFWNERRCYFSGDYYQQDLGRLFAVLLRPGDQYIDVGANIGVTVLMASGLVGSGGQCMAFEPNPIAFERLARHLDLNQRSWVEHQPVAIAASESVAELMLVGDNMGLGTLAPRAGAHGPSYSVRTIPADSFAARLDAGRPTLMKIDVEGYECQVLGGMGKILDLPEVAIVTEVNESMLRDAGHSQVELFNTLLQAGFRAHAFSLESQRWSKQLCLQPLEGPQDEPQYDVLFTKPGSNLHRLRVTPYLPNS